MVDILGIAFFPDADVARFIWPADKTETPIPVQLEGHNFTIAPNTEYSAVWPIYEVLANSSHHVSLIEVTPASPAADAEGGDGAGSFSGGSASGADTFDADAVIHGNVKTVVERLQGLTPEQLTLVIAAETDREVSRKGVIDAAQALLDPAGKTPIDPPAEGETDEPLPGGAPEDTNTDEAPAE